MLENTSDKPMTKEESYLERRQLFKSIWETAMNIGNEDIMNKPKVIKTLRMDEIDKCPVGKTKKQRIKNLRHVCNRILEFCDRQDADDRFYKKIAHEGHVDQTDSSPIVKTRKLKRTTKSKVKKSKSMFVTQTAVVRVSVPENMHDGTEIVGRTPMKGITTKTSPIKRHYIKTTTIKRKFVKSKRSAGEKKSSQSNKSQDFPLENPTSLSNRKEVKKRQGTKKKKHKIQIMKTVTPNIISV